MQEQAESTRLPAFAHCLSTVVGEEPQQSGERGQKSLQRKQYLKPEQRAETKAAEDVSKRAL